MHEQAEQPVQRAKKAPSWYVGRKRAAGFHMEDGSK